MTQARVQVLRQCAALPPLPPNFPPLATELLSEGPAPRQSYFYLFTVRATSSLFLSARLPPAPSRLSVLDPRGLAPRVGVGVGQAQTATGYRLKTPHCVQGCEVDPG